LGNRFPFRRTGFSLAARASEALPAGEIVDELAGGATGAARTVERETQRLGVERVAGQVDPGLRGVAIDDREERLLVEAVEAEHEPESVGEGELLLVGLAEVELAGVVEAGRGVVRDSLREEVPTVAGRDHADVRGRSLEAALERGLELAIGGLAFVEREIVAEQQESVVRGAP
jgi:hypothetical protein